MDRTDVIDVMSGAVTLAQQVERGRATLAGDPGVIERLRSTLVEFGGAFEVFPGTKRTP